VNGLEDRYEAELGVEAADRQRQAAKDYHRCCGEWKGGPHHEVCKNYERDAPAEIDGQERLI
jgi:hypothetical protein